MKHLAVIAALLFVIPLSVHAGTTGCLSGTITDDSGMPVANALVTATSPSQVATTRTDARGWFRFVSLTPDTYTIASERVGYSPTSMGDVTVFADNRTIIALHQERALRAIALVVDRHWPSLMSLEVEDVYEYQTSWGPVPVYGGDAALLRLTPGITSGPGTVTPR